MQTNIIGWVDKITPYHPDKVEYGYIYKVSNTINDKLYIGQTRKKPNSRWTDHKYNAASYEKHGDPTKAGVCRKFYNAINKHGVDNFIFEAILIVETSLLDEVETDTIRIYNSAEHGYNLRKGGNSAEHHSSTKKIISVKNKKVYAKGTDQLRSNDKSFGLPNYLSYSVKYRSYYINGNHPIIGCKDFAPPTWPSEDCCRWAAMLYLQYLDQYGNDRLEDWVEPNPLLNGMYKTSKGFRAERNYEGRTWKIYVWHKKYSMRLKYLECLIFLVLVDMHIEELKALE